LIHTTVVGETHDLRALRLSRAVDDLLAAGKSRVAIVHSVFRRVTNLRLDSGYLLSLSAPEVALAPNGVAIEMPADSTMTSVGLRPGQAATLSVLGLQILEACLHVTFAGAAHWEPRPRARGADRSDLCSAALAARAMLIAEGGPDSLLPLLWICDGPDMAEPTDLVASAAALAALLYAGATRYDPEGVRAASKGLAGLGPGLTPSGDDFLAGFAASWVLTAEALGVPVAEREWVASEILKGASASASELGLVWLVHSVRGEVAEPMGRFFASLLAGEPDALAPAMQGILALGATSGTDWLVGAVLGVEAVLSAESRGAAQCEAVG